MKKLILIVILFIISNNYSAIGGSYMGTYYRPHTCVVPIEPIDLNEVRAYRLCIESYLERAKKDIERIQQRMNSAIMDANNLY
jgi:hypothetical protein